jgi:hypothetical protein
MRQAIEEGFILDVLQNYTTYEQYYSLLQATTEDPHCSTGKLVRALQKFVNLNEEAINEKVAIILEHFCDRVQQRINGKALPPLSAKAQNPTASTPCNGSLNNLAFMTLQNLTMLPTFTTEIPKP